MRTLVFEKDWNLIEFASHSVHDLGQYGKTGIILSGSIPPRQARAGSI